MAGDAGDVAGVGAGDSVENEHRVFDAAGHGAKFIEGPAESHGASARDAAVGGAQASDSTAHAGADDAASRFAADGKCDERGGGGGAGTSAAA